MHERGVVARGDGCGVPWRGVAAAERMPSLATLFSKLRGGRGRRAHSAVVQTPPGDCAYKTTPR